MKQRLPHPISPCEAGKRSASGATDRFEEKLRTAARLLLLTLREIFDENAYQRFLDREHAVVSRESYARFIKSTHAEKQRTVKCC